MITARDTLAITYTNAAPQGDTFEETMDYIMRQIVEAATAGRVRTELMTFRQFLESPHASRIAIELRNAGFKFTTSNEGCYVEWSIPAQREVKELLEKRNATVNYTKTGAVALMGKRLQDLCQPWVSEMLLRHYDHHFTETVGDIRLLMEGGFCITVTHTPTKTEK